MARPAEASTVSTEAMGMPRTDTMMMTRTKLRMMRTMLKMKPCTVDSSFVMLLIFFRPLAIRLMMMRPTMSTMMATTILPATAVSISTALLRNSFIPMLPFLQFSIF